VSADLISKVTDLHSPRQVGKGEYPVVAHVGRSSGDVYRTPLDVRPTRGGEVLVVKYGPKSDWVRNILASGSASLRVAGEERLQKGPQLASREEAVDQLVPGHESERTQGATPGPHHRVYGRHPRLGRRPGHPARGPAPRRMCVASQGAILAADDRGGRRFWSTSPALM